MNNFSSAFMSFESNKTKIGCWFASSLYYYVIIITSFFFFLFCCFCLQLRLVLEHCVQWLINDFLLISRAFLSSNCVVRSS